MTVNVLEYLRQVDAMELYGSFAYSTTSCYFSSTSLLLNRIRRNLKNAIKFKLNCVFLRDFVEEKKDRAKFRLVFAASPTWSFINQSEREYEWRRHVEVDSPLTGHGVSWSRKIDFSWRFYIDGDLRNSVKFMWHSLVNYFPSVYQASFIWITDRLSMEGWPPWQQSSVRPMSVVLVP